MDWYAFAWNLIGPLMVFGALSFAYIAAGAGGGFGGGGTKARNRGRFIIAVGVCFSIAVLLFGSMELIAASIVAFIAVMVFWMVQR